MPTSSTLARIGTALSVIGTVILLWAYPFSQASLHDFLWLVIGTWVGLIFLIPFLHLGINAFALVRQRPPGWLGGFRIVPNS